MVRVETVLNSWKTVRLDTAQAVEDFPGGLEYKAAPELASFREVAMHILDAGHGLTGLLLEGMENFQTPEFREKLKLHASSLPADAGAEALARELRAAVDLRHAQLSEQPPEFYSKIITRFDGQQVTRLEMLQFVKEHELTHRSQLFMYLRLNGVVPATTRRRQAKK